MPGGNVTMTWKDPGKNNDDCTKSRVFSFIKGWKNFGKGTRYGNR